MYYMFMDDMQIPIPPEKMRTRIKGRNRTFDLLADGEINILKAAGLTEIEFKILLPNASYPCNQSILGSFAKAQVYIDKLQVLKTSMQPFQFIMVRMTDGGEILNIENTKVTLENYDLDEDAMEGYDFYADIHLKQYKDYNTKKITVTTDATGAQTGTVTAARSPDSKTELTQVTAKAGDTLQTIIKKNFGSVSAIVGVANSISFIQQINKIAVPAALAAGQIIKIRQENTNGTNTTNS
jgi:hypothetical protein